jgi:hypothetical protein
VAQKSRSGGVVVVVAGHEAVRAANAALRLANERE